MKKLISAATLGIVIGLLMSIGMSLLFGEGAYFPANPHSTMGSYYLTRFSSVMTLLLSVGIWAAIGVLFALTSRIFEQGWSLLKMTGLHFCATAFGFTGLGILAGWFSVNWGNLLFFWAIYLLIYLAIYYSNYKEMRRMVKGINRDLGK